MRPCAGRYCRLQEGQQMRSSVARFAARGHTAVHQPRPPRKFACFSFGSLGGPCLQPASIDTAGACDANPRVSDCDHPACLRALSVSAPFGISWRMMRLDLSGEVSHHYWIHCGTLRHCIVSPRDPHPHVFCLVCPVKRSLRYRHYHPPTANGRPAGRRVHASRQSAGSKCRFQQARPQMNAPWQTC